LEETDKVSGFPGCFGNVGSRGPRKARKNLVGLVLTRMLGRRKHLAVRRGDHRLMVAPGAWAGVPRFPITGLRWRFSFLLGLNREAVSAWIEYLEIVVRVHRDLARIEQRLPDPYLVTPPASRLPPTYRPPYRDLPEAFDHDHIVGTITREDGLVETVCVLCGV